MAIERTNRQKRKAFRALLKRLIAALAVSVLILSSLYLYDYLTAAEWLAIDEIQIDGVCRVDSTDLERLVDDIHGQNILLVPLEQYVQRLTNHPRIRNASISRVLPNRVICKVEEQEPVALLFTGQFLEVNTSGFILGSDDLTPLLDLPIITGISGNDIREGKICSDPRLRDALVVLECCKRFGGSFAEEISELKISDAGISIISLRENSTLILGDGDYKKRLRKFFLLRDSISREKGSKKIIDLRFRDQVVLRDEI